MKRKARRIIKAFPKPADSILLPAVGLRRVTSRSGYGVYASADELYKDAVFGRDSLEVAEDLLYIRPKLVRSILLTMVQLQGQETNKKSEEERGKIIHEYRNIIMDGKAIDERSLSILNALSKKWGGDIEDLAYFGSIDATPLFLRVLAQYCRAYSDGILKKEVVHRNKNKVIVNEAAQSAVEWLVDTLKQSKSGLLEYQRTNPEGLLNQAWKDSEEFYVHENGKRVNHERPIASIEVQGLAYDGLLAAAELFPAMAEDYKKMACDLRDKTIKLFWLEDRNYFALGSDYDKNGKIRIITTPTANPASLLDSQFFDDLEPEQQQKYITGIIKTIMSNDFLTAAGIRSRALSAAHLIDFWDYHGSFVSWPKETYDIARGLRKHNFPKLARQLENRLLNIVFRHRQYPEFVYVDKNGRILSKAPAEHSHGDVTLVNSPNDPERIQAWTVSAIMATVSDRVARKFTFSKRSTEKTWQSELEHAVYVHIPHVSRHLNPFKLRRHYPSHRYRLHR